MKRDNKLTGLVINLFNAKEADKVVHLLVENGSKVPILAKGIKKAASKKAHAIDLLNLIDAKFEPGVQLAILTDTKLIESFSKFKEDYLGLCFTQAVCELLSLVTQEEVEDSALFNVTVEVLNLTQMDTLHLGLSGLYLKILQIAGILPGLALDQINQVELSSQDAVYWMSAGGFTNENQEVELLTPTNIYKSIRFMEIAGVKQLLQLKLEQQEQKEMFKILHTWATNLLEKRLPAGEMLR